MARVIKLFLIGVIMVGVIAGGTWVVSLNRTKEDVASTSIKNCDRLEENIKRQIVAANYCRSDEECRAVDLRCPWGGEDKCRYVIVNRNHSIALIQEDAMRFRACMAENEEIKKKYEYCEKNANIARDNCADLALMKLKCVDRKCVPAE